uniref:Macro domain-containing protein n=1 Tax=Ursus maritimus TaxID=29073 RepID=A0A452SYD2_URSMA
PDCGTPAQPPSPLLDCGFPKGQNHVCLTFLKGLSDKQREEHYFCKDFIRLKKIPTWKETAKGVTTKAEEPKYKKDKQLNEKVSLFRGDITKLEVDAIVNAESHSREDPDPAWNHREWPRQAPVMGLAHRAGFPSGSSLRTFSRYQCSGGLATSQTPGVFGDLGLEPYTQGPPASSLPHPPWPWLSPRLPPTRGQQRSRFSRPVAPVNQPVY